MIEYMGRYSYDPRSITCYTYGDPDHKMYIGHFTSIASNIKVFLADGKGHEPTNGTTYPFGCTHQDVFTNFVNIPYKSKGHVVIGNDCWIGDSVTFMSGVTVGDGAVVATNSHVFKDVPPYSIVGGNPARIIKYRFEKEIIDKFLELQWWNLPDSEINKIIPELQKPPTLETFDRIREILKG